MGVAWIESHQSLRGHPKVRRAARLLDTTQAAVIGHLHCLWWWALDYAPQGDVSPFNAEDLADAADWQGDPGAFVAALTDCGPGDKPGFIENRDGRTLLHDWREYAGKLVDKRQKDAERKRAERDTDKLPIPPQRTQDVQRTSSGHPTDGAGTNPTNQPNQQTEPTTPTNPVALWAAAWQKNGFAQMVPGDVDALREYANDGMDPELIVWAIEQAAASAKRNRNYVLGILKRRKGEGITTRAQAEAGSSPAPNVDKPERMPWEGKRLPERVAE